MGAPPRWRLELCYSSIGLELFNENEIKKHPIIKHESI